MTKAPTISGDWLARARTIVAQTELAAQSSTFGRVTRIGDGVARISGLMGVRLNEILRFEGDRMGFALALGEDEIAAVILDDAAQIEAGSRVEGTGEMVRVPVGATLLGRVVDPLGRPLDRGEALQPEASHPIERPAPSIVERAAVSEMMATGVLVVDSLLTLGRGQRELIIGDRATGKTSLAVDALIAQRHSDVICLYVAVGQRASSIERVIESVRSHGAPERTIFVVASAGASPGLQWIAPFAGMTMAEYFRDRGQDVLIVFDDLTKHAATHRELALLTDEPPGREAYPGDVFYLHARLLERAAKLSDDLGGGSVTALPIAETDAGNLSGYIPTNLISITDGQIVLDSRLFAADQRPAVDVGLSVSRVGGKAQDKLLRRVSGRVRLDYAQFLELEMFTRFGGVTDMRVKDRIARGQRLRALFRQPRTAPLPVAAEVALLAALGEGVFDPVELDAIAEVRRRIASALAAEGTADADEETIIAERVAAVRAILVDIAPSDTKGTADG